MAINSKIDVFCLINISGFMIGEPIDSINDGIKEILNKLSTDNRTLERIRNKELLPLFHFYQSN